MTFLFRRQEKRTRRQSSRTRIGFESLENRKLMTTNLGFAAPDVEAEVGANIGGSEFGFVAGDLDDAARTAGLHEIVHALGYEGLQTSRSRTAEDAYFVKVDADTTANMDGGGEGDTLVHEVGHWL